MRHVNSILASILLVGSALAWASGDDKAETQLVTEQQCQELKDSGALGEVLAQRGCCSWHQGVCGCEGGRVTCCDGTFSPSCGCNHDDPDGTL